MENTQENAVVTNENHESMLPEQTVASLPEVVEAPKFTQAKVLNSVQDLIRIYSLEVHGENFIALAEQYKAKEATRGMNCTIRLS